MAGLTLGPQHVRVPLADTPMAGTEMVFLIQAGKWRRVSVPRLVTQFAPAPLLTLDVATTAGTKFVFTTPFSERPRWVAIPTWTANSQLVLPTITALDAFSITMGAMVSQSVGGLTLTNTFVKAPSGTAVQCLLLGH